MTKKKTPGSRDARMVLDLQLDPVVVRLGAFAVTWNIICTTLALLAGTLFALRTMGQVGVARSIAGRIACLALLGGFVGSRTVHVLAHAAYYAAFPHELFLLSDGSGSFAGALLGGGLAALFAAKVCTVPLGVLINAAVPSLVIGIPFHAIGNLLTGAGWGPPTTGGWGVIYWHPNALVPPDLISVPLHPFPIYQMVVSLSLFALWALVRHHAVVDWRLEQEVR
jgi:phosphatidylglycerol:prolipoprotein diacylglycerol transferase